MPFEFDLDTSVDDCPVEVAVSMIGGKWKPVLLFHLMMGAKRYSELQRLVPRASDRMLTRSLRELEEAGLVNREVFAEVPVRVEYSLTHDGETLYPILVEMSKWGTNRQKA
ncbi:winged helix-turn-helix transcriptional regulator [Roseobacter sp. MH60115]|uniref:winged helix-turn-helix transcriptional regulator n=1 Tax=Roseobacter sp. MH60115 TaxID=2785324 RepID=UPI0018A311AB|nr:helix-turn-helix domain-containing protein [Roseobacter sp. MH60115]